MLESFLNADGRSILLGMVHVIQDNKTYLGDVDGLIGDGDHGANMNKGFSIYKARMGDGAVDFSDGLAELGMLLLSEIGGSMGPIYGTVFIEMGDCLNAMNKESFGLADYYTALQAGLNGLYELVDARVGDKTLVDTYSPAVAALESAVRDGAGFSQALVSMKRAADEGMESTCGLVAKYGRSSRLGERSRGVLDAGAVSCCLLLNAMCDGILSLLAEGGESR